MNTSKLGSLWMSGNRWRVIAGVIIVAVLMVVAWIATTQSTQVAATTKRIQAVQPSFTMVYRQEYAMSDGKKVIQRYRYARLNATDWEFEIKELPAIAEPNAALGPAVGSIYRYERKDKQVTIYQRDGATGKETATTLEAGIGNEILSYWVDSAYIDRLKARKDAVLDSLSESIPLSVEWDRADIGSVSVDNTEMCKAEKTCTSAREEIIYSKKYQIPLALLTYRDDAVVGGIYIESLDVVNG